MDGSFLHDAGGCCVRASWVPYCYDPPICSIVAVIVSWRRSFGSRVGFVSVTEVRHVGEERI